jgi:hypothetical protein
VSHDPDQHDRASALERRGEERSRRARRDRGREGEREGEYGWMVMMKRGREPEAAEE